MNSLSRDWRVSNALDALGERFEHEEMSVTEIERAAKALGLDMMEMWKAHLLYEIVKRGAHANDHD